MGEDKEELDDNFSKMFTGTPGLTSDEQLALQIIHKFNICRDTLETMPAFDEHLTPLFVKKWEK